MNNPKIVMLAGRGDSTNILFHALKNEFPVNSIILEEPVSKKEFLKKRVKKLGFWKVSGQVVFQLIIVPLLNLLSVQRKKEIIKHYKLDKAPLPSNLIITVRSVNEETCIRALQSINPDLVLVNGTRIISKQVLDSVPATFINIHAGITPMYRGVHGAYWALLHNDAAHCGVTIHFVDAGIDTGTVIAQQVIPFGPADNFVTYPLLQLAAGIPLMKKAITDILQNDLSPAGAKGESRLWHHPGFFQYLYYRLFKGKK